jgi:tetratricopeptide (TPR) repeat protein
MDKKNEPEKPENAGASAHDEAIRELKPIEYIRTVNGYLLKGNHKSAYAVIQRAAVMCPDDPFVLSFYGCLQAMVDKEHRSGVDNCTKAIAMVQKKAGTVGRELLFPVLYLNLGKAYVAAGRKKNAVIVFNQGLHYDPQHAGILKELRILGARKKPLVTFLDRANPLNKYLGKALNSKK